MIKKTTILITALTFLLVPYSGYGTSTIADDLQLFSNVAGKLKSIKSVSYQYKREFTYPSENYHSKSEGEMYIDFSQENDLAGFRYQYRNAAGFSIFNNSEIFDGNTQNKTITIKNKLKVADLEGRSPIYNSIITLRNILPLIIKDNRVVKHVSDTLIANKSYHLLTFEMQNKYPDYLGTGFSTTTLDLRFYQRLIVDKETLLPITMLQKKKGSEDLNRTDFVRININPAQPTENTWYYSSYLNEYKTKKQQPLALIKEGQMAPDFRLINQESGLEDSLSRYKGQIVLLEFWIKNCGFCIEAVPKLNTLNKRYTSSKLRILGINTEDSESSIESFIKRNQVEYPVLRGNDPQININYGIASFPQVVLIDRVGIVIYSGYLDTQKLGELIDKSIQQ